MYTPNFNDPRVKARTEQALEFVNKYVHDTPNWLSRNWLHHKDHFGQRGNKLSNWLRTQLLVCVDEHWNKDTGKCKQYKRNTQGYLDLLAQLYGKKITSMPLVSPSQQAQLASGLLDYTLINDRYYNSLQNISTHIRKPLLASYGYKYNYDVVCAAPTLIRQYAGTLGLTKTTPALDLYIHNRTAVRERISQELDITAKTAKQIVHAMITGAMIGANPRSAIFQYLNYDRAKIVWLQQDTYIQQLKTDISNCWQVIKKNTTYTSKRFNGKDKSRVYRSLEKQVMDKVYKWLKRDNIRVVREHDGWKSDQLVDQIELRSYIRRATGYIVDFDYEVVDYV